MCRLALRITDTMQGVCGFNRANEYTASERNSGSALTSEEHRKKMTELETERDMLKSQVAERRAELMAIQSAVSALTNSYYQTAGRGYSNCPGAYPSDWTNEQRAEASARKTITREVTRQTIQYEYSGSRYYLTCVASARSRTWKMRS